MYYNRVVFGYGNDRWSTQMLENSLISKVVFEERLLISVAYIMLYGYPIMLL